jgi:hypothetical protein
MARARHGLALLVGAAIAVSSGAARASATLVQNRTATGTTPVVATWTSAVTAGHLLVATVSANGAGGGGDPTIPTPAGWTRITSVLFTSKVMVAMFYIENCSAKAMGSTETFTTTNSSGTTVRLMEFSGIVTSASLDVSGTNTNGTTNATVSTTGNVSTSPSLGVAIFAHQIPGVPTFAADAPYSDVGANLSAGAGATGVQEDSTYNTGVTSGGPETATVTGTGGTHSWAAAVAVFKEAPLYWIGRTGNATCPSGSNFTTTTCWSTTSGGASAGVVPGTSDRANFDAGGVGNCALDANIAGSISMTSAYTGTITQGAQNLSLASDLTVGGGTFLGHAGRTLSTKQSGTYNGGIVVSGGTFTGNGATLDVQTLFVSSGTFTAGTGNFSTNDSGLTTLSGGTSTFSSGTVAFAGLVTLTGGTVTFGSGQVTMASGLDVDGSSVTFGSSSSTTDVTGTVTVESGTVNFTNGTAATDFTNDLLFTQSGGTINMNGAKVTLGTSITTASNPAFTMSGGAFNNTTAGGTLFVGTTTSPGVGGGGIMNQTGSGAVYTSIATANETFNGPLNVSGSMSLGTATLTGVGGSGTRKDVTINAGGTLSLSSAGMTFSNNAALPIAGTLNLAGTVSFACAVTLTGALNAGSATTTITGAVTMTGTSTFGGGTGTTTFTAAPVLTAGTFTVGDAASAGSVILSAGATFTSGMTLAFPTSGGTLSAPGGQTLALDGTVTSSAGTATTPPKIARSSGATGITISFGATSVLDVNGLEFDNSVAAGVSIASGATYTLLERLKFKNNMGGGSSTHLLITLGSSVINVPGCTFDNTAAHNVELDGTGSGAAPRAIFEKNAALNGALAGEAFDLDSDSNADGAGENTSTGPYFGSVVEWVDASPADTTGAAAGYPTPAFDWNTFAYYGIYAAYSNGTGSQDVLWQRKNDGTAAYSYSFSSVTYGTIVGTPWWDTVNETLAAVDANGNSNQTDTDVHIVYIATSLGYIIKLVDNGSTLALPAAGPWSSPVKAQNVGATTTVATITSPLIEDGTNLYFGGTDQSAGTKIFGVQISGGANEAKLMKNVAAASAVTAAPSWTVSGGSTFAFLGSTAVTGQAYIYRVNMSSGSPPDASFSGVTATVNDSVRFVNAHAYAVTDGGTLHVIDALNFGVGAFKNITSFPYQTTAASPIKFSPFVDYNTGYAYFGDDSGKLYVVTNAGALLNGGYPFSLGASIKVTSSPVYLVGGGVIAVGANDGYLYFVNRNGSGTPAIFKRYFVSSAASVSSVSYDYNISAYMVSSSDGKLMFIDGADVPDPDGTP